LDLLTGEGNGGGIHASIVALGANFTFTQAVITSNLASGKLGIDFNLNLRHMTLAPKHMRHMMSLLCFAFIAFPSELCYVYSYLM
jgi:hypothetical protein